MAPRRTAAGAAAVKRMREIADANDAEMVGAERAVNAAASDSAVAAALQQRAALYIARGRKAEALADLRQAVALDQRRPRDSAGRCRRVCLARARERRGGCGSWPWFVADMSASVTVHMNVGIFDLPRCAGCGGGRSRDY